MVFGWYNFEMVG